MADPIPGQTPTEVVRGAEAQGAQIVTKVQAEAKAKEAEGAFSALMDQMEASRETQGDYFVKLGTKQENPDNRALLLIEAIPGSSPGQFVVITRDGPKKISNVYASDRDITDPGSEIRTQFIKPGRDIPEAGYAKSIDSNRYDTIEMRTSEAQPNLEVTLTDLTDQSFVNRTFDASVRAAEAPHKRNLEHSKSKLGIAQSLSAKISQLPPKE